MKIIHLTNEPYAPFAKLVEQLRMMKVRIDRNAPTGYSVQRVTYDEGFMVFNPLGNLIAYARFDADVATVEYDAVEFTAFYSALKRNEEAEFRAMIESEKVAA
jgi:hypothetical protein